MKLKKVPAKLYKATKTAVKELFKYDRLERYVLIQVLTAAEQKQPIDDVYIKCANKVLQRHPFNSPQEAA